MWAIYAKHLLQFWIEEGLNGQSAMMLLSMLILGSNQVMEQEILFLPYTPELLNSLCNLKSSYCAFIDFRKVFDYVHRSLLWIKSSKIGIHGKLLKLIKALYNRIKSCLIVDCPLIYFLFERYWLDAIPNIC